MNLYTADFYRNFSKASYRSAEVILEVVYKLIRPKSIADVGCGLGLWLEVAQKYGIEDFLGIDGGHVEKSQLRIHPSSFMSFDLKKRLEIQKKFDLVLSLEVAEHLPEEYADIFIDSLSNLGNHILFSAAIPFQGGTHHVNEQWPEYWANKFKERDFVPIDIRSLFLGNPQVAYYYQQNLLLFIKRGHEREVKEKINSILSGSRSHHFSIVHPELYLKKCNDLNMLKLEKKILVSAFHRLLSNPGNSLILFGAGEAAKRIYGRVANQIKYIVDNNKKLWGTTSFGKQVFSPQKLLTEDKRSSFIIVASMYYNDIKTQLEKMGFVEGENFLHSQLLISD